MNKYTARKYYVFELSRNKNIIYNMEEYKDGNYSIYGKAA